MIETRSLPLSDGDSVGNHVVTLKETPTATFVSASPNSSSRSCSWDCDRMEGGNGQKEDKDGMCLRTVSLFLHTDILSTVVLIVGAGAGSVRHPRTFSLLLRLILFLSLSIFVLEVIMTNLTLSIVSRRWVASNIQELRITRPHLCVWSEGVLPRLSRIVMQLIWRE